ncbi:MAG: carbon starvation protein, partial [Bradymonadia bacterium]
AMVAVVAAASLPLETYREMLATAGPIAVFSNGVGGGIAALGVPEAAAITFVSLAVSAFALTSLDTCTRLARFLVQELATPPEGQIAHPLANALGNRFVGTSVVVAAGGGLCLSGEFAEIWPVFGAANQLLAAIALLAVSVWLARRGRKFALTLAPAAFMFAVTMTALTQLVIKNTGEGGSIVLATVSVALLVLALVLLLQGVGVVRSLRGVAR